MEKYIGIGFIILCFAILIWVIGIVKYQLHIDKEKINISPTKTDIKNKSEKVLNKE